MLTISIENCMLELKDGSIKNVGATNKSGTAKLFGVEDVEVRPFGDKRVKLVFEDDAGNEIQIALFPEEARTVRRGIQTLEDGPIFEDDLTG